MRNKIDICALLETRVKQNKFKNSSKRILKIGQLCIIYKEAVNGKIWISWNYRKFDVIVVKECAQGICCRITELEMGNVNHFTAVHGFNTIEMRK